MKKFICALSALAMLFTACQKPGNGGQNTGGDDADYEEITLSCSIDLMEKVESNGYDVGKMVMPGREILDFFDMTEEEFYHAMGTYTGTAPNTSQVDNIISFGVCPGNDQDLMKFVPSSTNNFGCWLDANMAPTTWGDDAVLYHESLCEWGLDEPGDELDNMWTFGVGFFPDHNSYKAGDEVKATYFFQMDAQNDGDKDLYCYVEMIMNITAAEEVKIEKVGELKLELEVPYDDSYGRTTVLSEEQIAALVAAVGEGAKTYAYNSDGTVGLAPATDIWFDTEGMASGWGAGCALNIHTDDYSICNFPDDEIIGGTFKAGAVWVNSDNKGYYVSLTVTLTGEKPVTPTPIDETLMHDVTIPVALAVTSDGAAYDASEAIFEAFQLTADDFKTAARLGMITVVNFVDDVEVASTASGLSGNWFDKDGAVCGFGDVNEAGDNIRSYYVEFHDDLTCVCGFYDSDMDGVNGKTIESYSQKVTFTTTSEKTATATLNYSLSFNIQIN